jgi:hypothetical protein
MAFLIVNRAAGVKSCSRIAAATALHGNSEDIARMAVRFDYRWHCGDEGLGMGMERLRGAVADAQRASPFIDPWTRRDADAYTETHPAMTLQLPIEQVPPASSRWDLALSSEKGWPLSPCSK